MLWRAIVAWSLLVGVGYLSYAIAYRLLRRPSVGVLWSGAFLVGMGLTTLLFHVLFAGALFRLEVVSVCVGVGTFLAHRFLLSWSSFCVCFCVDLATFWELFRCATSTLWKRLGMGLLFLWGSVVALRVLLLPPLGIDTLTYHGVRAAMWVQSGGPISMEAPGGWEFQKYFSPGGEIFLSWAMLPMHNDLLVTSVDIAQWVGLGIVLFALGRALSLRPAWAFLGMVYILTLPRITRLLGSGYVELGMLLAFLGAVLFLLRFRRFGHFGDLILACVGLGVAANIKFNMLIFAGWAGIFLLWHVKQASFSSRWGWAGVGILLSMLLVAPWPLRTWQRKGTPFYPIGVQVAGVKLGTFSPALMNYQKNPRHQPYLWSTEFSALKKIFSFSPKEGVLGFYAGFLMILWFLFGMWSEVRRDLWRFGLLLGLILLGWAFFFHPRFSLVRLEWSVTSGRFLLLSVALCALLAFGWMQRLGKVGNLLAMGAWGSVIVGASSPFFVTWRRKEFWMVGILFFALVVVVLLLKALSLRIAKVRWGVWLGGLGWVVCVLLLSYYKQGDRMAAWEKSVVLHKAWGFWKPTLRAWERSLPKHLSNKGAKIAITSGPWKTCDNWVVYPFLGSSLQHRVTYLPVTARKKILPFGEGRSAEADFSAWYKRLREQGVQYVLTFPPLSVELGWVLSHPERFQPLSLNVALGSGLFRVLPQATNRDKNLPKTTKPSSSRQ